MTEQIKLRESLKPYLEKCMKEASLDGSPLMRTMFYEFPEDPKAWELKDQYMFGSEYLVAPVLKAGITEREVYLPQGKWQNIHTNEVIEGGCVIKAMCPRNQIPVFKRQQNN